MRRLRFFLFRSCLPTFFVYNKDCAVFFGRMSLVYVTEKYREMAALLCRRVT